MGWVLVWAALVIGVVKTTRWWSAAVPDPEEPSPRRWIVPDADEDGPTGRWDPAHASDGLAAAVARDRLAHPCPCDHHAGLCARSCACRRTSFPWGA